MARTTKLAHGNLGPKQGPVAWDVRGEDRRHRRRALIRIPVLSDLPLSMSNSSHWNKPSLRASVAGQTMRKSVNDDFSGVWVVCVDSDEASVNDSFSRCCE